MSVLFPFSAPAPRNASFEVFLLCQLCCGVEVPCLFSAKPVRNRVHSYHCSGYKCIFFSFFYTFPPSFDALSGSLRPAQICPRVISLRSSLWHSYLSLSVPLTTSTPVPLSLPPSLSLSLSLSLLPLKLFFPLSVETVKPICFGDTFTGCPCWTMTPGARLAQNCHMI